MLFNALSDPIVDFGQDAINVGEDVLNTINPANWSKFHVLASFNKDANERNLDF